MERGRVGQWVEYWPGGSRGSKLDFRVCLILTVCPWASHSTLLDLHTLIWENRSGGGRCPRILLGCLSVPRLLPPPEHQQRGDGWAAPSPGHWLQGGGDPASCAQAGFRASNLPCSHFPPHSGLRLQSRRGLAGPFIKHTPHRPVGAKINSRSRAAQSPEAVGVGRSAGEGMSSELCGSAGAGGAPQHKARGAPSSPGGSVRLSGADPVSTWLQFPGGAGAAQRERAGPHGEHRASICT